MRKWIVFDDGVLTCSETKAGLNDDYEEEGEAAAGVMRIPMDRVISLRTDVREGTMGEWG